MPLTTKVNTYRFHSDQDRNTFIQCLQRGVPESELVAKYSQPIMPRSEISLPVVPTGVPRSTGTRSKTTARSAAGQPPPYDAANYAQVRIFPKTDSVQSYEMAFRQPTQHTMSARSARSKGRSVQQSDTGAVGCCGAKKKPKKKSGGCCDWGEPKSRVTTQKLKPPGSSATRGPMRHGTRSEMTPQRDDPRFAEQRPVRG